MIPKIIHYCWFGGSALGEEESRCIASWKKHLPDYEIKLWNESNWDVHCCDYVSEAYEAEKWAFVSDYARFDILYKYGGVYFDTDVELVGSIDDILSRGSFMGCEKDFDPLNEVGPLVAPGLGMAAIPGLDLYAEILASYNRSHFLMDDGTFDQSTVVERVTGIMRDHGLQSAPGIQSVSDIVVYPSEYFSPQDFVTGVINITDNTRSIHHFKGSWLSESEQWIIGFKYKLIRLLPWMNASVANFLSKVSCAIVRGDGGPLKEAVRLKLKH